MTGLRRLQGAARVSLAVILWGLSAFAAAEVLTLGEVKAKSAVRLSLNDLKQLVPGSTVADSEHAPARRSWQNKADGTLVVTAERRTGSDAAESGAGSWRLADDGAYCVTIKWNRRTERTEYWCRYIFKAGAKYYGFDRLDDSSAAIEFEFTK